MKMESTGWWQSTWSVGALAPSPQLQGGAGGSEGSEELTLLAPGGCGSIEKLL